MNPQLLPVLDEISAVLKKHDVTGLVIVGNQTHVDWRMHIEASWNCAKLHPTGELRIRSKLAEYPSREAQKACLESTIGNFVSFGDALDRMRENMNHVLVKVAQTIPFIGKSVTEE